jgi:hypothetical protein
MYAGSMARWPRSGWAHAAIAVVVATPFAAVCFRPIEDHQFQEAIREAPHDGQDGLSAFAGAIGATFAIWVCTALVLFVVQRLMSKKGEGD